VWGVRARQWKGIAVERRVACARLLACAGMPMLACVAPRTAAQEGEDAEARAIVERADAVRFPREGFEVEVTIASTAPGEERDERAYRLLSRGNENTVVMTVAPASERGQILLMRGRDLWIFLPNVSQPVRLSLAQRLTGQVANGDLARANFAGDYVPKLAGTEVLDGERCWRLELTAVDRSVTYGRVSLWVRQANHWPHRADFHAVSGRRLKTCRYEAFREMAGRVRPTRMVMEDALREGARSVLEYSGMKLRDLPDKVFTRDYLKRLE
jgi:outer membrane lipoprotein-sorting protein